MHTQIFWITYVTFCDNNTRSATIHKLCHNYSSNNKIWHFYFNQLPRLWNALLPINIDSQLPIIKPVIYEHLWIHFITHFNHNNSYIYHFHWPCHNCCNLTLLPFLSFLTWIMLYCKTFITITIIITIITYYYISLKAITFTVF